MSNRSPVPNLPPLSGVQDPSVRAYLDALTQAWTVRNGQTRNTDEKFLTVKDLKDGVSAVSAKGSTNAINNLLSATDTSTQGIVATAMQSLIDAVQQSKLYKLLGERIALIETPEWFQDKFGAEVQTVITKQENATNALAQKTDTAITNINGNMAIAQQEIKAVSDTAGAAASAVTSLQTTVNQVSADAEESLSLAQSVDETINGAWTVKFDVNGYVTGAGLGLSGKGGSYSSEFIVRADRFSIAAPVDPNAMADADVPFIVTTTTKTINGVTYPPGTWIKTAFISDLSVDTLKLQGNAITVPVSYDFADVSPIVLGTNISDTGGFSSSEGTLVGTFTVTAPASIPLTSLIIVSGRTGFIGTTTSLDVASRRVALFKNNALLFDYGWSSFMGDSVSFSVMNSLNAGETATYKIRIKGRYYDQTLDVTGAKLQATVLSVKR